VPTLRLVAPGATGAKRLVLKRCPSCRGIWIDRGEIEALVSQAVTELQGIRSREAEPRRVRECRWFAILVEVLE